jgi:hypothetical protein
MTWQRASGCLSAPSTRKRRSSWPRWKVAGTPPATGAVPVDSSGDRPWWLSSTSRSTITGAPCSEAATSSSPRSGVVRATRMSPVEVGSLSDRAPTPPLVIFRTTVTPSSVLRCDSSASAESGRRPPA